MLEVQELSAGYANAPVVTEVAMRVSPKEVVALFGHNGAGKSTLLKAVFGLLRGVKGQVRFKQESVLGQPTQILTQRGMALVPQGQGVFPNLTVGENLKLGLWSSGEANPQGSEGERRLERVFRRLPMLKKRWGERAGNLSGGQQQMVSIGRALVAQPSLLLLDEPSVGLAPKMVEETMHLVRQLKEEEGIAVILVEQNVRQALKVADRVYVMKSGRMILETDPEALKNGRELWNLF